MGPPPLSVVGFTRYRACRGCAAGYPTSLGGLAPQKVSANTNLSEHFQSWEEQIRPDHLLLTKKYDYTTLAIPRFQVKVRPRYVLIPRIFQVDPGQTQHVVLLSSSGIN